jgi:hypothetical protein
MELEIQYWIDEALENATRATGRILGRAASTGVRLPSLDQEEASNFDLTASKAAQAVMRAVTAYPLSDAQLERIVRMTLGKRVIAATTTTAGGNPPPQATTSAVGPAGGQHAEPEAMSEDKDESHGTDCTGSEGPPLTSSGAQPASPRSAVAAALMPSEVPAAQQPGGSPLVKATATVPGGKKKSRAAKRAARAALEANGGTPAADGDQTPQPERPQQCPVYGCTREHDPGDCPTFLDMTPKERLGLVHAKQLCLLCLQHPLSIGCEVAGEGSCCMAKDCGRQHHVALHGVLKAGKSSPLEGNTDPPEEFVSSVDCGIPETVRQLRGLLEGLGIDPGA